MTHTNNKLQEEIAALTAKYEFEEFVKSKLPNLKTMAFVNRKRILVEVENKDQFKEVLAVFPTTNTITKIGSASSDIDPIQSPYRIDIDNPCSPNSFSKFKVQVSYQSDDTEIQVELPIEVIKDWVTTSKRKITDSEYHYFIGYSHNELRKKEVMCYVFPYPTKQISWYGGNKTLQSEEIISEIIDSLNK